jgi:hypothetical protein
MRHDGHISVDGDGFRIELNSRSTHDVKLGLERLPALDQRQRFTLAHEIIHTLLPMRMQTELRRGETRPKGRSLEALCQFGAGLLVVPEYALRSAVDRRVSVGSGAQVAALAEKFEASPEVMLRRLANHDNLIDADSAVIFFEPRATEVNGSVILAGIRGQSLVPYLSRPTPYSDLLAWLGRHWQNDSALADGSRWWSGTSKYAGLRFHVSGWRRSGRFFLDIALISL